MTRCSQAAPNSVQDPIAAKSPAFSMMRWLDCRRGAFAPSNQPLNRPDDQDIDLLMNGLPVNRLDIGDHGQIVQIFPPTLILRRGVGAHPASHVSGISGPARLIETQVALLVTGNLA